MSHSKLPKLLLTLFISLILAWGTLRNVSAYEDSSAAIPTQYGFGGVFGNTFDPVKDIYFLQLASFIMWDYDKIWRHWAPEPLRFKVEGTAGVTTSPETRAMVSVSMLALYYLEFISTSYFLPYLEGGIGIIYTDFQVEGQGLRFNFYPQIGIGTELKLNSGAPFFAGFRLTHISNADLHEDNRGVNSVVLIVGRYF